MYLSKNVVASAVSMSSEDSAANSLGDSARGHLSSGAAVQKPAQGTYAVQVAHRQESAAGVRVYPCLCSCLCFWILY
jgi:hypothetical protein